MKAIWNDRYKTPYFHKNKETVAGTVTPIKWNTDGIPTQFSIYTYDDEDIIILNTRWNNKLKDLKKHLVEATGIITENTQGEKSMVLTKIIPIDKSGSPIHVMDRPEKHKWYQDFPLNLPHHSLNY